MSFPTHRLTRRCAERIAQANPHAGRPAYWPFGALTEAQTRARNAQESALRQGRFTPWASARGQMGRASLSGALGTVLAIGGGLLLAEWAFLWILQTW